MGLMGWDGMGCDDRDGINGMGCDVTTGMGSYVM